MDRLAKALLSPSRRAGYDDPRQNQLCFSYSERRAAMVAAVSGETGQALSERQQLLKLDEPAIRYVTEIMHRRPRQWFEDVDRVHPILQSRGRGSLAPGKVRKV